MDAMRVGLASEALGTGAGGIRQQRRQGGGDCGGTLLALHEGLRRRGLGHIATAGGDDG